VRPLPTGTVTLLFSDIEGSTLMLNRLGDRWGEALSAQRSILRAVWTEHDGHEMGTEGDSFFVVFPSASQALAAAVEGQRRLQRHDWPNGVALRVRMGLHTGEPQRHEDGYIGMDVHLAARIAATANGGQIVVSSSTHALVGQPPEHVSLRDLGQHRLKDIAEPEQLYDVEVPGLLAAFPPLRSLGTRANLPTYSTEIVGRELELAELQGLIGERGVRLVTLTGPGGTGKTRLAVELASLLQEDYPCNTFFVELHTADRAALMWSGIAEAVGAVGESDQLPHERALRFLSDRQALLVLDNLEQVVDADVVVSQLLNDAPHVRVIATSRRPLHLVDEHEYPVSTLAVPERRTDGGISPEESGAVALFVRRAAMVRPRFALTDDNVDDVVALCRRLDGLPLALELAAARCRLLSPRALLSRIDERLGAGVTASDRTERQRTLGATIAWSYDLLTPEDQQTFRRLGVFSSRVDLPAIEEVAASEVDDPLDAVAHLVDVSLVKVVEAPDGEPMITMLETIRQFARDRLLESGECDDIRLRHARWCLQVSTEISGMVHGPAQMSALDRMSYVEEDIRAALDWCLQPPESAPVERRECGYALLASMNQYWYRFGYAAEGRGWYERGLAIVDSAVEADSAVFVDALHGAGMLAVQQNDLVPGTAILERALETARRMGDRGREARECNSLGIARREAGDIVAARELIERSLALAQQTADPYREATALSNIVMLHLDVGDYQGAVDTARRAVAADQALKDPWGVGINQCNLVFALLNAEGARAAYEHVQEVGRDVVKLGDLELSVDLLESFAAVLAALGEFTRAATLLGTSEHQRATAGLVRSEPDQHHIDRFLLPAREQAGADTWDAALAAGRLLTIDDALNLGLDASLTTSSGVSAGAQ
jgi:predicted ATPase/class 3 adenylate cyclase